MPRADKFPDGQIPMGIRLPKGLYEEVRDRADVSGIPIAEQFRRALRMYFDANPVKGTAPKLVSLKPSRSVKKGRKRHAQ
jgi:hypothetical protein